MKFKTVREGQQAVVYNHLGEGRLLEGPTRVFLFRERLVQLPEYTANESQYLEIKDLSGLITHQQGPYHMFGNPLEVDCIHVKDSIKIDSNHMIIVYKKRQDNVVERRIVQGPAVFMPQPEEWLHDFTWHGEDTQTRGRMVPNSRKFKQLTSVPEQFNYNVREVRTTDDTVITIKVMIFYEMRDVLKMLDATHDPIADLINAMCADIIAFVGKLTFTEFLTKTSELNSLPTYSQLLQRAQRVGYDISKVVYTGYHSSEQLQTMQDNAIHSRTQLRLNAEFEEQQQRLMDLKLNSEQERAQGKQELEQTKLAHRQQVDNMKQAHQTLLQKSQQTHKLDRDELEHKINIELTEAAHTQELAKLEKLKDLDVDMTKYLLAQQPPPVHEEIQVVSVKGRGGGGGGQGTSSSPVISSAVTSTRLVKTVPTMHPLQ